MRLWGDRGKPGLSRRLTALIRDEEERVLRLGHSPDPDDAFMFYALAEGKLDTGSLRFEHILQDVETLNRWAMEGRLEVTALSVHAYAYVASQYALLPYGASMGSGYGPIVVAREPLRLDALRTKRIAVPGTMTTAFLTLRILLGEFSYLQLPFDRVLEAVAHGECEAGLLIHEGQLTYQAYGLERILDLGEWWHERTGLPLPLGVNAVRKDLGSKRMQQVAKLIKESIQHAFSNREEALRYAIRFARGLDQATTDRFVAMYVNDLTLDWGPEGRRAIELLLTLGSELGAWGGEVGVEVVEA